MVWRRCLRRPFWTTALILGASCAVNAVRGRGLAAFLNAAAAAALVWAEARSQTVSARSIRSRN